MPQHIRVVACRKSMTEADPISHFLTFAKRSSQEPRLIKALTTSQAFFNESPSLRIALIRRIICQALRIHETRR